MVLVKFLLDFLLDFLLKFLLNFLLDFLFDFLLKFLFGFLLKFLVGTLVESHGVSDEIDPRGAVIRLAKEVPNYVVFLMRLTLEVL
jgi:hypothetical protein